MLDAVAESKWPAMPALAMPALAELLWWGSLKFGGRTTGSFPFPPGSCLTISFFTPLGAEPFGAAALLAAAAFHA